MSNELRLIDANAFEKRTLERFNTLTLALVIGTTNSTGDLMDMEYFKYWLNSQPTVDAKPVRHGEWLYSDIYLPNCAECSECGWKSSASGDEIPSYHYCPHCGAKMEDKDE